MTMFRVIYEIDIEADTAEDAALEVYQLMIDPSSIPPVFDVIRWSIGKDGQLEEPEYGSDARESAVTLDCETLLDREDQSI